MDKRWQPEKYEEKIYQEWEKSGIFTPKIDKKKKPFSIIMPPPNANGALHIGHAMFATIEDIIIRYQRSQGKSVLWLPGADHAGILTQVVFEKELAKKGKTRFDLGRKKFIEECLKFTLNNKKVMYCQLKLLGASCDWTREKFTLDKEVTKIVYQTFFKLYQDQLVYRDWRLVNWCPRCQTALSDLEVIYQERKDPLYYLKYGPFTLATTRPETKFGDTAVAVSPKDKRYQKWIGKEFTYDSLIGPKKMKVIADQLVDPEFGTGVVKVTPAHDPDDFQMGQKHNLEIIRVIGHDGRLNQLTKRFAGLTIEKARKKVVQELKERGDLVKIDQNYLHRVGACERCKTTIEPMVSLQWFIKMKPLAKKAIEAVKGEETKIIPKYFEKTYFNWLENIKDWCISRQLWWGHQLPIWYCGAKGLSELQKKMNPEIAKNKKPGCGKIYIRQKPPQKCSCGKTDFIQDPDTFDTWFSSGQWPYSTLGYPDSKDYQYFYPTSVMETGYDILFFWVARMIILGLYRTKKVPFKTVYLHGMVRDAFGQPMSKSRPETCIDPAETIKKYGADALRMALVYGTSAGKDVVVTEDKVKAMRNFANKIWNAARFISLNLEDKKISKTKPNKEDREILKKLEKLEKKTNQQMEKYRFGQALEEIYQFFWHQFCDLYLEKTKNRIQEAMPTLLKVLTASLKLLHPFAPFVTQAIFQKLKKEKQLSDF